MREEHIKMKLMMIPIFFTLMNSCFMGNKNESVILRCIVYPQGSASEFYTLEFISDKSLKVVFEEVFSLNDTLHSVILKKEQIFLSELDFTNLIESLDSLNRETTPTEIVKGGNRVIITIGNDKFDYYDTPNKNKFNLLYEFISNISPMRFERKQD